MANGGKLISPAKVGDAVAMAAFRAGGIWASIIAAQESLVAEGAGHCRGLCVSARGIGANTGGGGGGGMRTCDGGFGGADGCGGKVGMRSFGLRVWDIPFSSPLAMARMGGLDGGG